MHGQGLIFLQKWRAAALLLRGVNPNTKGNYSVTSWVEGRLDFLLRLEVYGVPLEEETIRQLVHGCIHVRIYTHT